MSTSLAAQIPARIILIAVEADFEVNVGTRGIACIAGSADHIALIDNLARHNINTAEVGIECFMAIAMIYDNQVTITEIIPAGVGNCACI